MMSLLPDLTPRDPHSLWYTSSRYPPHLSHGTDPNAHNAANPQDSTGRRGANPQSHHPNHAAAAVERSQLARLRADEQYAERRRLNVQSFGSTWLRPAGVAKTLHMMREERREQEEHQEALRREALAQELADAAAEEEMAAAGAQGEFAGEEEGMDDVQLEEANLDDEIPEADDMGFGSDSEEDEDEDHDDDDEDGEGREGHSRVAEDQELDDDDAEARRLERAREELVTAGMRRTGDAFREALARGHADPADMYGADGDDLDDDEGQANMLDEEDFFQEGGDNSMLEAGEDMDMEADLDDEIPEGELTGYEHTDSEAELSSSDDEYSGLGRSHHAAALAPPQSPTLRARTRNDEPRVSMDLSSILSRDETSFMESSPAMRGSRRQ